MSVGIEVAGRHKESRNFTRSCKFSCVSAADSREGATALAWSWLARSLLPVRDGGFSPRPRARTLHVRVALALA